MTILPRLIRYLATALMLCAAVRAQETTADEAVQQQELAIMQSALGLRSEIASSVSSGNEKPEEALKRLQAADYPSGFKINPDAGFGLAAIDVGHRLLLRHPAEAEIFFKAAEQSLEDEVQRTSDEQAKDKAQYLQSLAHIRSNYLNKPEQAQADIEAAARLQPEDKQLERLKARLTLRNETARKFQDLAKGGAK